jgi:hypothetical protein
MKIKRLLHFHMSASISCVASAPAIAKDVGILHIDWLNRFELGDTYNKLFKNALPSSLMSTLVQKQLTPYGLQTQTTWYV